MRSGFLRKTVVCGLVISTVLLMLPGSLLASEDKIAASNSNTVKVGKITQWYTKNGMEVLYQPARSLPMIDFRLIFDAGAARDSLFKSKDGLVLAGLAKLTNGLIFEGTDNSVQIR